MSNLPTDPQPDRDMGDRYIYVRGSANRHCCGGCGINGYWIVWLIDDGAANTDAECMDMGFYGCCGTLGCGSAYYCAYKLGDL